MFIILFAVIVSRFSQFIALPAYFVFFSLLQWLPFIYYYILKNWSFVFFSLKEAIVITYPIRRTSLQYWSLSITIAFLNNSLPWIISGSNSLIYSGQISLIQRLFLAFLAIQIALMLPIQTRLARIYLEKNVNKLKNIWIRLNLLTMFGCILISICVFFASKIFLQIWVKQEIVLNSLDLIMLCTWFSVWGLINLQSIFLNSMNKISNQTYLFLSLAIIQVFVVGVLNSHLFLGSSIILLNVFIILSLGVMLYFSHTQLKGMHEKALNLHPNI
jgi:hypothetical protein